MKLYNKSYLDETDNNISSDIISRKEFLMFKKSVDNIKFNNNLQEINNEKNIIPKFLISDNIPESNYLELRSYQMLTRNYLNPNTPYSRLLLKWETGHGKTIAAIGIALNFIDYYKKQDNAIGSVYIIGFTQNIFKEELLKYPEFGFITREELVQLNTLKKTAHSGSLPSIEKLRKFVTTLKKRLFNRKDNGFFKFIGYKELANHLFIYVDKKIDLLSISDEYITDLVSQGKLKINKELLDEFTNSLIICDEIHNVYNTNEKNNWGVALQTILNYHDSCRALFLSATPLNNSPTEIIDLLNLLLPRKQYPSLKKTDFFNTIDKIPTIIKSREVELGNYLKGRISFVRDRNPKFIATKKLIGSSIPGIDYLKFIRCPMSKFHYNTYSKVAFESKDNLGIEGQYLVDYLIPNPNVKNPYKSKELGLYKPNDVSGYIISASLEWKEKMGISFSETNNVITGSILKKNNISAISTKYNQMIDIILKNITEVRGKMFIYHNYIHMTGTLLIQEILLQNNIIGEFDTSKEDTLCICGKQKKFHEKTISKIIHSFKPIRFIIVHSGLEKSQVVRSLEKFNNSNNITGSEIMILIGSKIMKEAHSINSVRNIIIMSRPDNISTLIQIIGRAIRLNSHKLLPMKQQHVDISILVSSVSGFKSLSFEEQRYQEKIETFKVIQNIEKLMHINAIDAYFNYDTIWESTADNEFGLDILPYAIKFKPEDLNLSTFNVYHAKFEVDYFISIIKRLFIEISSVWLYKDLYNAVKLPPFPVEINSLISQDIFNIALNTVVYNKSIMYVEPNITDLTSELNSTNLIDKLQNPDDKIILISNNIKHVITHVGELYSLAPLYNDEIFVDTESIYRSIQPDNIDYVDIMQYLKYESTDDYVSKKMRFINKWKLTDLVDLESALCDFGTAFHITFVEEIIQYIFNVFTQVDIKKDENHAFYLKMIYFYDLYQLIAWAHLLDSDMQNKYEQYVTPISLKLSKNISRDNGDDTNDTNDTDTNDTDGQTNQLIASLNHSDSEWISTELVKEYNNSLSISEKLFDVIYKKTNTQKKVMANLLPVGHYLSKIPRFYLPSGWYEHTNIKRYIKENTIIIGIDQRSKTGLTVKFKLRSPTTKNIDSRYTETGISCSSKKKLELIEIAKKLNINTKGISNTEEYCKKIRQKLIYLELKEHGKINPVKYFYNVISNEI